MRMRMGVQDAGALAQSPSRALLSRAIVLFLRARSSRTRPTECTWRLTLKIEPLVDRLAPVMELAECAFGQSVSV